MDTLADRVSINKLRYHFLPPGFGMRSRHSKTGDPDKANIEELYAFCHKWVFGKKPKGSVWRYHRAITDQADELGVSIKMLFLANMAGWKYSNHGNDFYAALLLGDRAREEVLAMSKACQDRYGAFDILALDRLIAAKFTREAGCDRLADKDFEQQILSSEILAGSWIVNYKLFHAGQLLERFYKENETSLNPHWLAIEPTYFDEVLSPYFDHQAEEDAKISVIVRNHRYHTMQLMGRLKRGTRRAITLFTLRERVMPQAVERVLNQHGYSPEDFEVFNVPVIQPIRFWANLGLAILQMELLKCVDGESSVLDRV